MRTFPAFAVAFFLAMVFFVTYPGYLPFDRIRPFILGLPFALFWQVLWIVSSILVLGSLYLWEKRRSVQPPDESDGL